MTGAPGDAPGRAGIPSSPATPAARPGGRARWAIPLDAAAVVVFTLGGATAHERDLGDLLRIGWPFAVGLAVMWALPLVHRAPARLWPAGVIVWVGTAAVGLALRWLTGGGMSGAFPVVTVALLGAVLLGWRAIAWVVGLLLRHRSPAGR